MTAKPDWISVDGANNRLIGNAGFFSGATQAAANAAAQNSLNNWGDAAMADGSLFCYDAPVLLKTITGFGGTNPFQSAWDPDTNQVWTTWGWNVGTMRLSRLNVTTDAIGDSVPTGATPYGLQYVGAFTGSYSGTLLYYTRGGQFGKFITSAPYTQTDLLAVTNGSGTLRNVLWIPEKSLMFVSLGTVAGKVRLCRIDFSTGVSSEFSIAASSYELYNSTYNPVREEIISATQGGGASPDFTAVNVDTLAESTVNFVDGATQYTTNATLCSAYCPDNGLIYMPYQHLANYGVALVNADTFTVYGFQSLSTAAVLKSIVYHEARKYMYIFGTNFCHIVDTTKYNLGSSMIVGTVPFTGTVQNNPAVYCPTNRLVYLPIPTSRILVFT